MRVMAWTFLAHPCLGRSTHLYQQSHGIDKRRRWHYRTGNAQDRSSILRLGQCRRLSPVADFNERVGRVAR